MIDYTLPLEELPDPLPIEPLRKPFDVTITPPGSKSITCRAYVLAALAEGESRIIRPLRAEDTDLLLRALCTLGAEARWTPGGEDVLIKGVAGRFPRGGSVNLGDGGTPTRFMIACACLAAEPVIVDGSPRMRERPIAEGVDMLRQLGAKIEYVEEEGRLPVRVMPLHDQAADELAVTRSASSQGISAVLLIAPWLHRGVGLSFIGEVTSQSYVALTTSVLEDWGAAVFQETDTSIDDLDPLKPEEAVMRVSEGVRVLDRPLGGHVFEIEPDASSALYFVSAVAVARGCKVYFKGVRQDSVQPDSRAIEALVELGVTCDLIGSITGFTGPARFGRGIDLDASAMPDGAMALAVTAVRCQPPSRLTGLRTLRVKETDRVAALANELRKVGCTVERGEDWIEITPHSPQHAASYVPEPALIETYNDHRMAMAFAVLGLVRPGISIRNPVCVRKSYPGFWQDFAKLYQ